MFSSILLQPPSVDTVARTSSCRCPLNDPDCRPKPEWIRTRSILRSLLLRTLPHVASSGDGSYNVRRLRRGHKWWARGLKLSNPGKTFQKEFSDFGWSNEVRVGYRHRRLEKLNNHCKTSKIIHANNWHRSGSAQFNCRLKKAGPFVLHSDHASGGFDTLDRTPSTR